MPSDMKLLDGRALSKAMEPELRERIAALSVVPALAVVIVGERTDSLTYVAMKQRAFKRFGLVSERISVAGDASQDEVCKAVRELNANPAYHGILVQLPLPKHIDERSVLDLVSAEKDVDGLSSENIGRLVLSLGRGLEAFHGLACTPRGIMHMLRSTGQSLDGKHAVVIGRSDIVGKPIGLLLLGANCTVTTCHSRTHNLHEHVRRADIVVAACGRPGLVRGDWIRPGAIVIDVGINAVDDATTKRGYRLVGDVEFDEAAKNASWITPVPGGCGPMTIVMLVNNTVNAATNQQQDRQENQRD